MSAHSTPAGPGPSRREAEAATPTREAIVSAAETVIRESGLRSATTRRIAGAAGCSEGSIYTHFASKDELIADVVCERLAAFPEYARTLPTRSGHGSLEANLTRLAALAIEFFTEMMPLTAALMADPVSMRAHAAAVDAAGKGPRWTIAAIVAYLRREQELGRVAAHAHLEGAATALVGGALHHAHLRVTWQRHAFADDQEPAAELAGAVAAGLHPPTAAQASPRRSERP